MAEQHNELTVEQLRRMCDPSQLTFHSTADLPSLNVVVGQDRAVHAVSFGVDIDSPGYHMFALGETGTGKRKMIRRFLESRAGQEPTPDDWCYVNNFDDPDRPRALRLPAGKGCELNRDVNRLVEELQTAVGRAFEGEQYEREQQQIQEEFDRRRQALFEELENEAHSRSFTLLQTSRGIMIAPVAMGNVITPEQFGQLDEEARQRIEQGRDELQDRLRETMRRVQQLQRELRDRIMELDRQVVGFAVEHLIDDLVERYASYKPVVEFLQRVREDILNKVEDFKRAQQTEQVQQQMPMAALMQGQQQISFDQYKVNLVIDNCNAKGAPVILEDNPTYYNLVGRVEHQAQFGALVTNYSMIKPGALHRANGGYLMLNVREVLLNPFAWDALKRALRSQDIRIEMMGESYRAIPTRALEPEPIPLDVKVVLIGEPMLYYLLYNADPDFQELFKVKADFGVEMDWAEDTPEKYAQFIAQVCREENLKHFSPSGVAKVVEYGARIVADKEKVATKFGDIVDLVRQASYWSKQNGSELVEAEDVQKAIEDKIYRSNRIEERLNEMIEEGTILIDTQGEAVGQINGLSVMSMGDHMFGKPSRITVRTHMGNSGVVNIDREVRLGGRIHNKGVMILAGYLGGRYAADVPLAVSASVTFEQVYEEVEGDSASSAELYALLSSLSACPIKQSFAVTGSVNQQGQVQAIGGVNEKIEGFFDVCRLKGLTGEQGVMIPRSNVKNLMLREDVVQAVRDGQFHIYAVSTIDEGIEILTGREAGQAGPNGEYPEGTVNWAVQERLRRLAERARRFGEHDDSKGEAGEKEQEVGI